MPLSRNRNAFFEALLVHVQELIDSANIDSARLIGCSIGMPGLIDTRSGENFSYLLDESGRMGSRDAFENQTEHARRDSRTT